MFVVKDPVASVWTEPHEQRGQFTYPAWGWPDDPAAISLKTHDTQLMYGEKVHVLSVHGSMYKVAIPGQPVFDKKIEAWRPLEGYVNAQHLIIDTLVPESTVWTIQKKSARITRASKPPCWLPFGAIVQLDTVDISDDTPLPITLLNGQAGTINLDDLRYIPKAVEDAASLREALCANAKLFLGMPYCWGGRSPFFGILAPTPQSSYPIPTSVDCSGIFSLLMQELGFAYARNSGDQIREKFTTAVEPAAMRPGDVFYLKPNATGQPTHILMYLGDDQVYEASGRSGPMPGVCTSSVEERFGLPLTALHNGIVVFPDSPSRASTLTCRSFFDDAEKLQMMRDNFFASLGCTS